MKYMVLMKATAESEAGRLPSHAEIEAMMQFNEQLAKDGVLVAAEGLRPSSKGTRLEFGDGRPTITDGPFTETKELLAGLWIVEGASRDEVIERFTRAPLKAGQVVEIREFFQAEDFAALMSDDQVQRANQVTL